MANFQVLDAYGSVITIQSSTFGSAERQIVGGNFTVTGNPSVSGTVNIGNMPSVNAVINNVPSVVAIPVGNQSVSGAIQISGLNNSSIATVHVVDDPIASSMVALVTDTIIHGRTTAGGGSYVEVKVDPSGALVTTASSVVTFQGTTPWNIAGSVAAFKAGNWVTSISGVGGVSTTTSVYQVLSSITTVSVLNLNLNRIGATIFNNAGTNVYIKLGTAATTSIFTVLMNPNDYYELPFGYTGVVGGISASNAGVLTVTEIT